MAHRTHGRQRPNHTEALGPSGAAGEGHRNAQLYPWEGVCPRVDLSILFLLFLPGEAGASGGGGGIWRERGGLHKR